MSSYSAQALDFDLIVFPPYRALEGFCHDMEVRSIEQGLCKKHRTACAIFEREVIAWALHISSRQCSF